MKRSRVAVRGRIARLASAVVLLWNAAAHADAPPSVGANTATPAAEGSGAPLVLARSLVLYGFRRFQYREPLSDFHPTAPPLPGYDLERGVGMGVEIECYPFASSSSRSVEFGAVASLRREAMFADSKVATVPVAVSSSEWQAALRLQIPLGAHELGVSAGAGTHAFSLTDARGPSRVPFPDVAWSYARLGIDGRLETRPLFVGAAFGYRAPFASGQIGSHDWFPHLRATGFDASIHVGVPLSSKFELTLGYELRRYAVKIRSEVGDRVVAGGAVDVYGSGWIAWGVRF